MSEQSALEEAWRGYLTGTHPHLKRERRLFRLLPSAPRCKLCNSPFRSIGGMLMRLIGKQRSTKNPNYCNMCNVTLRRFQGGAEVPLTMLFADVRGSTTLAERMTPSEFTHLLNRFYHTANHVLIDSDALVDKLVGDEVIGLYPPYLSDHPARAIRAARDLLLATGHGEPGGPWLPIGAGVHTGVAYVGIVGSEETVYDLTALGDAVNITARLASLAGPGEILISNAAHDAAGLELGPLEPRRLQLKGRTEPVDVRVLRVAAGAPSLQRGLTPL